MNFTISDRMTESPDLAQIMHQLQSSSSTPAPSEADSQPIRAGNLLPNGKKTKGEFSLKIYETYHFTEIMLKIMVNNCCNVN